jgi:hypothetical protein
MYQKSQDSTVFSENTPHGIGVPHRYPSKTSNFEDLMKLISQLYPTGRAWYMPEKGIFRKFHEAVNVSFLRTIDDGYSIVNSTLPDNEDFTEEDCDFLEYKYGLLTNPQLTLQQRRNNIYQKMSYPRGIVYRQGFRFIQKQLNLYGFEVGVYENIFWNPDGTYFYKLPTDVINLDVQETQHGKPTQHGESTQHGSGNYDVIANSMFDESYNFGGLENLWATFFIAGKDNITDFAQIPQNRKEEFRQLVLKLKPAHTVGFLFINYI